MGKKRLWSDEQIIEAIKVSFSKAEVCRRIGLVPLGGNYKTIDYFIKSNSIDTSHFTGQSWNKGLKVTCNSGMTLEEMLTKDSIHSSGNIKRRLLKAGIRKQECESCGFDTWLDQPISLELDHIDGDKFNNLLDNLRLLCPNCHSQTSTYRGRSKRKSENVEQKYRQIKSRPQILKIQNLCVDCKKEISKEAARCKRCTRLGTATKIEWPSPEYLMLQLETKSYIELSRELGVSDNSIRRYLKKRNYIPPKGPMISKYLRQK